MSGSRAALGVIALLLAIAEFVTPTRFSAKKLSHASRSTLAAGILDQEALDDLPPIDTPALGNIDAATVVSAHGEHPLRPGDRLARTDAVHLVGWCADPETHAAAPILVLVVDGRRRLNVTAAYHEPRGDVARYFANSALTNVGFSVEISALALGAGAHVIRMAAVAQDQRGIFVFPTPERVTVSR